MPAKAQEALKTALSIRTINEALTQPTINQVAKVHGVDQVVSLITVAVTQGMLYFNESRRLQPPAISLMAQTVMDEYPHESLADINVFMRGAALGKYGQEDDHGNIVKQGETYGQLDVERMMVWFRQYLGQKADTLEQAGRTEERKPYEEATKHLMELGVNNEDLREAIATIGHGESQSMIEGRLRRYLPAMTDDQLREQWKKHPTAGARSLIYAEAKSRGLAQKAMEEALEKVEPNKLSEKP